MPGTKSDTQRPIPPTFSVKLAFHPVKILTDSSRTRNKSKTSSANNVPLGNGSTEKRRKIKGQSKIQLSLQLNEMLHFVTIENFGDFRKSVCDFFFLEKKYLFCMMAYKKP